MVSWTITLHKKAKEVLTALGHNVKETVIDAGYDVEAESKNSCGWMQLIWQMPGWWMHDLGQWKIHRRSINRGTRQALPQWWPPSCQSDWRLRHRCLLQGKKHMLSLTWNAPIEAFTREGDFFEGKGVDALYMHFHKSTSSSAWPVCRHSYVTMWLKIHK